MASPDLLVVVGASGFGRETLDVIEAINLVRPTFRLLGVLDDTPSKANLRLLLAREVSYLGSTSGWEPQEGVEVGYVVGIGAPGVRERLCLELDRMGLVARTVIHPSATIGSHARIGPGSVICAGVRISTNVEIGAHGHVNAGAVVGHDTILHDFVSINPAAVISGNCIIEHGVMVGAAATVLQGLTVETGALVGAAACVVHDVPAGVVVRGVPAREHTERRR